MANVPSALHNAIAAACPIHGVCVLADGTVRIDYQVSATPAQIAAAQAAVKAFVRPAADPKLDMTAKIGSSPSTVV